MLKTIGSILALPVCVLLFVFSAGVAPILLFCSAPVWLAYMLIRDEIEVRRNRF